MARVKVDLAGMYSKAAELSDAEREIARLQLEVERLRASRDGELEERLGALRSSLASQAGVQEIPLDLIEPNPAQPRQTFSTESLETMARSLAKDGQIQPAIVMSSGEGFELFDGERRWRAARLLGWTVLKAIPMPRPVDLHRKALLTTLHREDLNPLDKAEALLKEITENTGIAAGDVPRILSTVVRRLDYQKRMKGVSELIACPEGERSERLAALDVSGQEKAILLVLLGLGLNPASVCANDFRTLSLFPDLQRAIRESHLKAAHAMVLQGLSAKKLKNSEKRAEQLRAKVTERVVTEKLSLSETKKLVKDCLEKQAPEEGARRDSSSARKVLRGLKELSLSGIERDQLLEFRRELLVKLSELEKELEAPSGD